MEKEIKLTKKEEYYKEGRRYTVYEADNGLRFEFKQYETYKYTTIDNGKLYNPHVKEEKVYNRPEFVDMQFICRFAVYS